MGLFSGKTVLLTGLYIFTIAISIIMLGLSFSQITRKTWSNSRYPFKPIGVRYDGDDDFRTAYCPWAASNSAARIVAYFAAIIISSCNIFFVLLKKNKIAFFVLAALSCLEFAFLFYVFIDDARDLDKARKKCPGSIEDTPRDVYKCVYGPELATAILNVFFVVWIPNIVLLIVNQFKWQVDK